MNFSGYGRKVERRLQWFHNTLITLREWDTVSPEGDIPIDEWLRDMFGMDLADYRKVFTSSRRG